MGPDLEKKSAQPPISVGREHWFLFGAPIQLGATMGSHFGLHFQLGVNIRCSLVYAFRLVSDRRPLSAWCAHWFQFGAQFRFGAHICFGLVYSEYAFSFV